MDVIEVPQVAQPIAIDRLDALLRVLPAPVQMKLLEHLDTEEIYMDAHREFGIKLSGGRFIRGGYVTTPNDIDYLVGKLDRPVRDDNRVGIEGTLHRLSAKRDPLTGLIDGWTIRVGRYVPGLAVNVRKWLLSGKSVGIVGPPGSGKSTFLRCCAGEVASHFYWGTVVVDTSGEIGGDSEIPHSCIGDARHIRLKRYTEMRDKLTEAYTNMGAQYIIADEIGKTSGVHNDVDAVLELPATGTKIVATLHGKDIVQVLEKRKFASLWGLNDQKQRTDEPAFGVLMFIVRRGQVCVFEDLASTVDRYLEGKRDLQELGGQMVTL